MSLDPARGSGRAASAILAMRSENGDVAPTGYLIDRFLRDAHPLVREEPNATCRCLQIHERAEDALVAFISR
jgi:hypothetical protein